MAGATGLRSPFPARHSDEPNLGLPSPNIVNTSARTTRSYQIWAVDQQGLLHSATCDNGGWTAWSAEWLGASPRNITALAASIMALQPCICGRSPVALFTTSPRSPSAVPDCSPLLAGVIPGLRCSAKSEAVYFTVRCPIHFAFFAERVETLQGKQRDRRCQSRSQMLAVMNFRANFPNHNQPNNHSRLSHRSDW
jgi:hypothetical protein